MISYIRNASYKLQNERLPASACCLEVISRMIVIAKWVHEDAGEGEGLRSVVCCVASFICVCVFDFESLISKIM